MKNKSINKIDKYKKIGAESGQTKELSKDSATAIVKRIAPYVMKYKGLFIVSLISAVITVMMTLVTPVLIGKAIDCIVSVGQVNFKSMLYWIGWLIGAIAAVGLSQWELGIATNKLANYVVYDIRVEAFEHLHTLPLKYIDTNAHGNIMSRVVNDCEMINEGLINVIRQFFSGILTIVATIGFMLSINYIVALVVVLMTPLSLVLAGFIAKKSNKLFVKQMEERGEMSGLVDEMINGQKIVKAFGYEDVAEERFAEINERIKISGVKSQFISAAGNPATRFVNGLIYAAVGIVGAFSVLGMVGITMTVGQLSSFLAYANQYTKPFNEISGVVTEIQSSIASARRVFALIDSPPEIISGNETINAEGKITLEHVKFGYSADKILFKDLSLDVKSGDRIAIVGTTGSGKTTIINLLMRFYEIDGGTIYLDGIDITKLDRNNLRRQFGMVLQDTWLFNGTIRENIAYSKPDATDVEIIEASKQAHAHGFVSQLRNGYDTVIDQSMTLSEGQKQLLSIARIMLLDPPMLILDEATSNIDTLTELKLQRALQKMCEGRTCFIVAHRLSTIMNADKIIVIDNGVIVESGRHDELLIKGGVYANLYNSQWK